MKIFVMGLVFAAASCLGGQPVSSPPPPEQLARLVEQASPEIRAAQLRALALGEGVGSVGTLPNPRVKYHAMDPANSGNIPNAAQKRLEIEQAFPWFGTLSIRENIAARSAEMASQDTVERTRDLVRAVKNAWYEWNSVRRLIQLNREEQSALVRLEDAARIRYEGGKGAQQDIEMARAEKALLESRANELGGRLRSLQFNINALLYRPPETAIPATDYVCPPPLKTSLANLQAQAAINRPDIRRAEIDIERSRQLKRLSQRAYYPEMMVGAEYRWERDGDDMIEVTIGAEVPLWIGGYRAGVRQADREHTAAQVARDAVRNTATFNVTESHTRLQAARETLRLYQERLLPSAQARLAASEAGYKTGVADFRDFLDSELFLLNARAMKIQAETDVGMWTAQLEWAIGKDLYEQKSSTYTW